MVSAIHERFDPVPDLGRSIDSSIFVMRHVTFYATDFLKHIGHVLDRRHLSSCLPSLSRRISKPIACYPPMTDERQNLVTLEKLKSRSVIAGTRSLPVSDVIASAGLVKASIRLKARRGLS